MKRLQESIRNTQRVGDRQPDFIQFLSFSIDPERDSVAELKKWADRFQVNPYNWWLLTGDKKMIYDLSINQMKIGLVDGKGVDTSFFHTDYFVLIDRYRNVRGYYHGLDTTDLARLSKDIIFLTLEKDPKRKSFFTGKLEFIAVIMLLTLAGVGILLIILRKRQKAPYLKISLKSYYPLKSAKDVRTCFSEKRCQSKKPDYCSISYCICGSGDAEQGKVGC